MDYMKITGHEVKEQANRRRKTNMKQNKKTKEETRRLKKCCSHSSEATRQFNH
jgi:hypothetical protein